MNLIQHNRHHIFIVNHQLAPSELGQWEILEKLPVHQLNEKTVSQYILKNANSEKDEILKLDIVESKDWETTNSSTVELINNYMSTEILNSKSVSGEIGDIGFSGNEDTPLFFLFSRGNMTVRVSNIGKNHVPTTEISSLIDAQFTAPHEGKNDAILDLAVQFEIKEKKVSVSDQLLLNIQVEERLKNDIWLRLTCQNGRFSKEDGNIFFQPIKKGTQEITLTAIGNKGEMLSKTVEISVE